MIPLKQFHIQNTRSKNNGYNSHYIDPHILTPFFVLLITEISYQAGAKSDKPTLTVVRDQCATSFGKANVPAGSGKIVGQGVKLEPNGLLVTVSAYGFLVLSCPIGD